MDTPTREDLLRKYRQLATWRRAKDREGAGEPDAVVATPAAMRALAAEFPGALREMDRLGTGELERRAAVLERAEAASAAEEPWIAWIAAFHALMRASLAERRAGERVRSTSGRASDVVLQVLASQFGVAASAIARVLFPPRH